MEIKSVDEKRLDDLVRKLKPITKITVDDIDRYPEFVIPLLKCAKRSCEHIIDVHNKQNPIDIGKTNPKVRGQD